MKNWCLYQILFPNGKRYIGITSNFKERMASHLWCARYAPDRKRFRLHHAIEKYGWDNIERRILIVGSRNYICEMEIRAIAAWNLTDVRFGYNVLLGGDLAPTLNPDVAKRSGDSRKGIRKSEEHKRKISEALKGHRHSDATKKKIGKAFIGRKLTDEHKLKITISGLGRKHSEESRLRMSRKLSGKTKSQVHREALSAALRGRTTTPCSDDTKLKISIANKAAWAKRKITANT